MVLPSELVSQLVKATNDSKTTEDETTVYGTIKTGDNGRAYVMLDGSELLTPITTTAMVKDGDRVTVMIKNHTAIVTGNVTAPSAQAKDVEKALGAVDKISEFEIIVAYRVTTDELNAINAAIDTLKARVAGFGDVTALNAEIEKLRAEYADLEYVYAQDVEALNAHIENIQAKFGDFADISTEQLTAANAAIEDIRGYNADFTYVSADVLKAMKARIDELDVESLDAKYANIDFANIGEAAITQFFSKSGIIENVIVADGHITGTLVGVTIKGDLIEGGTVVADKLVIQGEDGLYYKLNTDGADIEAQQTEYNSLNGSVIAAKSITASKIAVTDLVAFGATIGGFHITNNALYSGVKTAVDNTTKGTYLDSDGQLAVGDGNNFIRYYKDTDGTYKLAISASNIAFASTNRNVQEVVDELSEDVSGAQTTADAASETAANAEALIQQLAESISMLVTDGNGTSLMTQTESGWTFSTADIQDLVSATSDSLNELTNEVGDTNHAVSVLQQAVADLGEIAEYVKIGTYNDEPCIELGEADSDFKMRITNTQIVFMEGSGVVAHITNQSLHIKKAVVEEELQQGGFVWKARANGNLGLVWKGVTS